MSNKLAVPISDQPYYDDSPIGSIKDWHIGVDSRARSTKKISGTCTADTTDKLTYATGGFTTSVSVGDVVYNSTDNVYAFVEAVDSDTVLSLDWDAFPDGNEDFEIYTPTTPGYGWNRLDTDLTVDDTSSPYYGLTVKAQQAKITEGYDTGWINADSGWHNKDFAVQHNLNSNISDLIVKFYVSTDGTDANSFEILVASRVYDTDAAGGDTILIRGLQVYQDSKNEFHVQTGEGGIYYISDTDGTAVTDFGNDTTAYYKVKVYRKQDIGIIPIIKTKAGLAVLSSLAVDTLTVNGQDYSTQKYTTGWVANSDWTDVDLSVTHNLGAGLDDLIIKIFLSENSDGSAPWEILFSQRETSVNLGFTIYEDDINSFHIQTGSAGISRLIDTNGANQLIDTEAYYYKVVVYAPQSINRYFDSGEISKIISISDANDVTYDIKDASTSVDPIFIKRVGTGAGVVNLSFISGQDETDVASLEGDGGYITLAPSGGKWYIRDYADSGDNGAGHYWRKSADGTMTQWGADSKNNGTTDPQTFSFTKVFEFTSNGDVALSIELNTASYNTDIHAANVVSGSTFDVVVYESAGSSSSATRNFTFIAIGRWK